MEHANAEPAQTGWWRLGALAVGGFAVAEVLVAFALVPAAGFGWSRALTSFLATNGLMGFAFASSGLLIAWFRPRHPLGWLLVAAGLAHATSALMAPVAEILDANDGPLALLRAVVTVYMFAWPWSIALFLPMALLLFPDGHLPSPRWRYAAWAIVLTAPLFVLEMVTGTEPVAEGMPLGYLAFNTDGLDWLWTLSEVRTLAALLVAVAALVVRYRRAGETERAQLLWLLMAGIVVVVAVAPWSFVAGTPIAVLFAIPLVPLAIAVAVVRHQLLDIRLVVSRALAWLLLSVAALIAYVAVVALLDSFVSQAFGRSAFATVLVAVALAPLLPRLQREVDRWMYGDRRDPARVAGRLGEALAAGDARGLAGVVSGLRSALRLPYVAVRDAEEVVASSDGVPPTRTTRLPLEYAGETVGELEIGLRRGEQRLSATDRSTLQLVATPLAVAIRALGLSAELRQSQSRLVVARQEERRRLRRDLHDGLGPTLTGMALAADAGANFLEENPARTRDLLGSLQRDSRSALADVRRLVDNLTPPALGELGLLGALERRAEQLRGRSDGTYLDVRLVVPDELPTLPADVEVAAYRIATEALVNIARHAVATNAVIEVRCNGNLDLVVTDDGASHAAWSPGVGLESMRERAAEVGGILEAGPSRRGGRVSVSIPVVAS